MWGINKALWTFFRWAEKRHIFYRHWLKPLQDVQMTLPISTPFFFSLEVKGWKRGGGRSGTILIKQGLCIDSVLCIRQKVKQMPGRQCHFKQWLLALESASRLLRKSVRSDSWLLPRRWRMEVVAVVEVRVGWSKQQKVTKKLTQLWAWDSNEE